MKLESDENGSVSTQDFKSSFGFNCSGSCFSSSISSIVCIQVAEIGVIGLPRREFHCLSDLNAPFS